MSGARLSPAPAPGSDADIWQRLLSVPFRLPAPPEGLDLAILKGPIVVLALDPSRPLPRGLARRLGRAIGERMR